MKAKLKNEFITNKKYLIFTFIISLYVFLPLFFISTVKQILAVLVSMSILFIVSKISKIIFVFLSMITLFVNSLIFHIAFHWGTSAIASRIEVASLSPKSESLEYLTTYLSLFDIVILSYTLVGMYILYKLVMHLKHSYRIVKLISLLIITTMLFVLFSLDKIQSTRPYTYIKSYISIADKEKIQERSNYINNLKYNLSSVTPPLIQI